MAQNLETKIVITAKERAARVLKRLTGGLKSVRSMVFSLQGAFAALGAGLLVRDLIQTASSFENLRIQLDALQGSAEAGEQAMAWVKDFAKETPLSLEGVTQAFVRAKALGLDPMDGTMQSLVDISSKLGGGQDRLMGIVLAVGQAWTKQKLQAEEANQLIERGVPVYELLSNAMNKSGKEIQEMAEKGELGRDVIKQLIAAMGASATGAAAANMTTFTGLWSKFMDQVSQGKDEFARAKNGLFAFVKGGLDLAIERITAFREDGSLKQWGTDIGLALINVMRTITIGAITAVSALKPVVATAESAIGAIWDVYKQLPPWAQAGVVGAVLFGPGGVAALALTSIVIKSVQADLERIRLTGAKSPIEGVLARMLGINDTLVENIALTKARLNSVVKTAESLSSRLDALASSTGRGKTSLQIEIASEGITEFKRILSDLEDAVERERKINIAFDADPILKEINRIRNVSLPTASSLIVGEGLDPGAVFRDVASEITIMTGLLSDLPSVTIPAKGALDGVGTEAERRIAAVNKAMDTLTEKLLALGNKKEAKTIETVTVTDEIFDAFGPKAVARDQQIASERAIVEFNRLAFGKEIRDRANAEELEQAISHQARLGAIAQEAAIFNARIRGQGNKRNLADTIAIGTAIAGASKASAMSMFLINKAGALASIYVNTQAAAQLAMSSILPPANFAVAAQIEADGFRRAAIVAGVGLAQGIAGGRSGAGGGGSGGLGGGGGIPQNFSGQQNQNQQGRVNISVTVNTLNAEATDWDLVVENMETALGDKIERNGGNFGNVQLQFDTRGG